MFTIQSNLFIPIFFITIIPIKFRLPESVLLDCTVIKRASDYTDKLIKMAGATRICIDVGHVIKVCHPFLTIENMFLSSPSLLLLLTHFKNKKVFIVIQRNKKCICNPFTQGIINLGEYLFPFFFNCPASPEVSHFNPSFLIQLLFW